LTQRLSLADGLFLCPLIMKDFREKLGKMAEALVLERNYEKAIYATLLQEGNIKERKEEGYCLHPMKAIKSGFGAGDYPFLLLETKHYDPGQHRFEPGTPAIVQVPGEKEKTLNGTVSHVQGREVKLSLHADEIPDWTFENDLALEMVFDNRVFEEMMRALSTAINTEDKSLMHKLSVIYDGTEAGRGPGQIATPTTGLNQSQREATESALAASEIAVVHGPPGTGKTTTLTAICRALLQEEGKIHVCAPSNAATDNLAEMLARQGLRVVRIGNPARMDESLTRLTIESLIREEPDFKLADNFKRQALEHAKLAGRYVRNFGPEQKAERAMHRNEFKTLVKQARDIESYLVEKCINRAQVVASTLTSANHFHIKNTRFQTVLIDEAGQATDPAILMALLKADKFILAGDPFQLPPTVKSPEAEKSGLSVTMLDRLTGRPDVSRMLTEQYRMNKSIMQFSNMRFYQSKLTAHPSVAEHRLAPEEVPLEVIDTAGCGMEESAAEQNESKYNQGEAQLVRTRLEELADSFPEATIGVISPYKEQVRLLKETLSSNPKLTVDTIDAFQGRERDVVILSLVRSNEASQIGFLKDYRRMNVALTRSRKKLIVIGDSATLGNDEFYNSFFAFAESEGLYRSGWEFPV